MHTQRLFFSLILAAWMLGSLPGCGKHASPARPTVTSPPAVLPNGLTNAETTTLSNLEKVDDYPLYTLHYTGDYEQYRQYTRTGLANPRWACSLFAAMGDPNAMIYGRNFDWEFSPALLLFTDPPDGYASVSMVDIAYLGFGANITNLTNLDLSDRQPLLAAPFLPFDGMNEHGLAIGMAAVPFSSGPNDPQKDTISSLEVIREILDHARNIDEAVTVLQKYNIDWGGGPPLHYLIADRTGHSVLVEFVDGKIVVLPNEDPWHLATNHLRANAAGDGDCWRYSKLNQRITEAQGKLTVQGALDLLSSVSQTGGSSTQWSVVYGMSTGEISVVMGREYGQAYTFELVGDRLP